MIMNFILHPIYENWAFGRNKTGRKSTEEQSKSIYGFSSKTEPHHSIKEKQLLNLRAKKSLASVP